MSPLFLKPTPGKFWRKKNLHVSWFTQKYSTQRPTFWKYALHVASVNIFVFFTVQLLVKRTAEAVQSDVALFVATSGNWSWTF